MTYSPLLLLHIAGGIVGFSSGFAAMLFRKGSRAHRTAGDVFVIAMLCMAASGGFLALLKSQWTNVLAGTFTVYLVSTAWLTVKRKAGEIGLLEPVLTAVALAVVVVAMFLGISELAPAPATRHGAPAGAYFIFAAIAFSFVSSDVLMLIRRGAFGAQRMARHLWRMGFALLIATGSFFLGMSSDPVLRRTGLRARLFTKEVRATRLPLVPVFFVIGMTLYWLCRVLFTSEYKRRSDVQKRAQAASARRVEVTSTWSPAERAAALGGPSSRIAEREAVR